MAPKPVKTLQLHRDHIGYASSYFYNSGNREAPWYGAQDCYLTDVARGRPLRVFPQADLNIHSSLWKKPVKSKSDPVDPALPGVDDDTDPVDDGYVTADTDTEDINQPDNLSDDEDVGEGAGDDGDASDEGEDDGEGVEDSDEGRSDDDADDDDDEDPVVSDEREISPRSTRDEHVQTSGTSQVPEIAGASPSGAQELEDRVRIPYRDQWRSPGPDGKSISSDETTKDKALSRIPDFVVAHMLGVDMKRTPSTNQDEEQYQLKLDLCASRLIRHRCLVLIEEDKRAPSRREGGRLRPEHADARLGEARQQLFQYVSAYFYVVPTSPGVVARATAGPYWQWMFLEREDVPEFDPDTQDTKIDRESRRKLYTLLDGFLKAPIFILGMPESDAALNEMRAKLHELVKNCNTAHTKK
ncbi:hypothetical protein BD626DRAFT_533974 [Schizophyllum amplum]|uniref:Uncharacterized protein n=1 Tax=Schizophyllum amplum TaxID=97359 RepID=A0A550CRX8_9AGAR|nr:hypothetical protein BD626DRAFT_533974 [Auriculariopsis ampla]